MSESVRDIDAVITWVDGNEPNHRKKWNQHKKENRNIDNELLTGRDKTRFINNGELKYCLSSIRKFAPWIRKIYVVTDDQIPEFVNEEFISEHNLSIIDHKTIFKSYEWALPTFNSRTLESMLWRIPDLSTHFIYFNDDFVLTKPLYPSDFFYKDQVVLRGGWKKVRNYGALRIKINEWVSAISKRALGITRSMNLLLQIKSAKLAGYDKRYFKSPHVPHPMRKKTISDFFAANPLLLNENIQYKFRNMDQFSAVYLANHLEIKNNNVIFDTENDFVMINGEMEIGMTFTSKLKKIINQDVSFLCIQGLESLTAEQQKELDLILSDLLGIKSIR
tara:strand:- start:26706 stop:27707 length:1002 start_codon:yes stop_codon:yes gene_type:complete